MALVEAAYRITNRFPESERFGLSAQLRRSAISVPSNIAEGAARRSKSELVRFLVVARGSLAELDTQLQLAVRLGFSSELDEELRLLDRTFARLNALIRSIEEPARKSPESS